MLRREPILSPISRIVAPPGPTNVTLSVVGLARFVRDYPQRLPGATAVAAAPREAVEVTVEPRTLDGLAQDPRY